MIFFTNGIRLLVTGDRAHPDIAEESHGSLGQRFCFVVDHISSRRTSVNVFGNLILELAEKTADEYAQAMPNLQEETARRFGGGLQDVPSSPRELSTSELSNVRTLPCMKPTVC